MTKSTCSITSRFQAPQQLLRRSRQTFQSHQALKNVHFSTKFSSVVIDNTDDLPSVLFLGMNIFEKALKLHLDHHVRG